MPTDEKPPFTLHNPHNNPHATRLSADVGQWKVASEVTQDMVSDVLWHLRTGQGCVEVGKKLHMSHNTVRSILRGSLKVMTPHHVAEAKVIRAMNHRSQRITLGNYRKGKNRLLSKSWQEANVTDAAVGDNEQCPKHALKEMQQKLERAQKQLDAVQDHIRRLTQERDSANELAGMLFAQRQKMLGI